MRRLRGQRHKWAAGKFQKQIPRRLKPARDDKIEELPTAHLKVRPFKSVHIRVFPQPVKPCSDTNPCPASFIKVHTSKKIFLIANGTRYLLKLIFILVLAVEE